MDSDEQARADVAFIERMTSFVSPDPSPRNPRVSRDTSHADRIEDQLQADGHRTWGYVIYRSTYVNDADWEELMRRLHKWVEHDMDFYNGRDVLDLMTWTVFDDRSLFDGVPTATIREHFKQWTQSAVQAEQSLGDNENPVSMGKSPRYRYCIQVDSDALSASLQAPAPPKFDRNNQGWVKLISKDWLPARENPAFAGYELDTTVYEPIEGVTEEHVGWVRCPLPSVMVEYYALFQGYNLYTVTERRPPAVIGYPWTS